MRSDSTRRSYPARALAARIDAKLAIGDPRGQGRARRFEGLAGRVPALAHGAVLHHQQYVLIATIGRADLRAATAMTFVAPQRRWRSPRTRQWTYAR